MGHAGHTAHIKSCVGGTNPVNAFLSVPLFNSILIIPKNILLHFGSGTNISLTLIHNQPLRDCVLDQQLE